MDKTSALNSPSPWAIPLGAQRDSLEDAMNEFMADIVLTRSKQQKLRRNMQIRRQLELLKEEQRLQKELCEYNFDDGDENLTKKRRAQSAGAPLY